MHKNYLLNFSHDTNCTILTDVPIPARQDLFVKKIRQCYVLLDFAQPQSDLQAKEIKREALVQCVEFLASSREPLSEAAYAATFEMVLYILFVLILSPSFRLPSISSVLCHLT